MAHYDKYDAISGGFRAPLSADWDNADVAVPVGVGLDANGRVVKGAGQTGVLGVLVVDGMHVGGSVIAGRYAGDVVDVMTNGEIVDVEGLAAGTAYYAAAGGDLGTTNTDTKIGFTVEAARLVVRS